MMSPNPTPIEHDVEASASLFSDPLRPRDHFKILGLAFVVFLAVIGFVGSILVLVWRPLPPSLLFPEPIAAFALAPISQEGAPPPTDTIFPARIETEWANWLAANVLEWRNCAVEVPLWDKSRVDLLRGEEAIEVDWAPKWSEAIGQSLFYARLTGKRPAILLLTYDPDKDQRHLLRGMIAASTLSPPLSVYVVDLRPYGRKAREDEKTEEPKTKPKTRTSHPESQ